MVYNTTFRSEDQYVNITDAGCLCAFCSQSQQFPTAHVRYYINLTVSQHLVKEFLDAQAEKLNFAEFHKRSQERKDASYGFKFLASHAPAEAGNSPGYDHLSLIHI